jgi:8-oxo-dGTP diphosphatase
LQKNPTIVQVVAAALIADDGLILMHCRPLTKQHGGLWEFPGGKVEPGEEPAPALARELLEELGIGVDPKHFDFVGSAQASDAAVRLDLFRCRQWTGEPQCLEGEAIGWFAPGALLTLAMPPLDVPLAEALIRAI